MSGMCGDSCCATHEHENEKAGRFFAVYALGAAFFAAALLTGEPFKKIFFIGAYIIFGHKALIRAFKNILRGRVFDENFLMSVATLSAIAMGEMTEAVFVMAFYGMGEFLQDKAADRSRQSIRDILDLRKEIVHVERNGQFFDVSPREISVGETIALRPGEKLALDGIAVSPAGEIDASALSGESLPAEVRAGDEVLSGSINSGGILKIRVTREYENSAAARIAALTEEAAERKSKTERFITKFAKVYTPAVVLSACALGIAPVLIFGGPAEPWVYRALVFLVVSCPCALVISVPAGYFSGIGESGRRGVLIKGGNYIDALAEAETVILDKTGTLTEGEFVLNDIALFGDMEKSRVLEICALAEKQSNHPIARAIAGAWEESRGPVDLGRVADFTEEKGRGVRCLADGAPVMLGRKSYLEGNGVYVPGGGGYSVYAAYDGVCVGAAEISGRVKAEAAHAVGRLKALGIKKIYMFTGDGEEAASKAAREAGIENVEYGLLPWEKLMRMEEVRGRGKAVFVGDGINDAPALSGADVGVAMGGIGSDAAIEAADVVIMEDNLNKVAEAIIISRNTRKTVKRCIAFALTVKIAIMVLGALGITGMYFAVFADVGVALVTILYAARRKI